MAVDSSSARRSLGLGVASGALASAIAFFWVPQAWSSWADWPALASWATFPLFAVWHGAPLGLATGLSSLLVRALKLPMAVAFPLAITPIEALWPAVFPVRVGMGVLGIGLPEQLGDVAGVAGLSFIVAATAGLAADLLAARRAKQPAPFRSIGVVLALWVGAIAWGAIRVAAVDEALQRAADRLPVLIVQPNVTGLESRREPRTTVERFAEATRAQPLEGLGLIVWSENAVAARTVALGPADVTSAWLQGARVPLLFGGSRATRLDGTFRVTNTLFLADASGVVTGHHDKAAPVPFAEAYPLERWFPALGAGEGTRPGRVWGADPVPLAFGGWNLAPSICYEDLDEGLVRSAAFGASPADVIVSVSNDSWLGSRLAARQHLAVARLRAMETRRPLLRAGSTGISAFIDPAGRVLQELPFGEPGVIRAVVGRSALSPPPWALIGDGLAWICALILGGLTAWRALRTRTRRATWALMGLCLLAASPASAQRKVEESRELRLPASALFPPISLHVGDKVEFKVVSTPQQELRTLQVVFSCTRQECSSRLTMPVARSAWAIGGGGDTQTCHEIPSAPTQEIPRIISTVFLGITPQLRFRPLSEPKGRLMPIARDGAVFVAPEVGTLEFELLTFSPTTNAPEEQSRVATEDDIKFAEGYWDAACKASGGSTRGGARPLVTPKIGEPEVTLRLTITRRIP